jgi:hypothetical protein
MPQFVGDMMDNSKDDMPSGRQARRKQRAKVTMPKGKRSDPNYLRDHERLIGPAIKYHPKRMPMQAAPDHGDHE